MSDLTWTCPGGGCSNRAPYGKLCPPCYESATGTLPAYGTDPMRYVVDVDWAVWHCPCGETLTGQEIERLGTDRHAWMRTHYPHTNGMQRESATPAARRWMEFESRTVPIELKGTD